VAADSYNPLDSIVFLTNRVGRLLGNEITRRSLIKDMGIAPQHIGVLVDLWMKDGVRQQDLAVSIIKDKGTIARALKILEKHNLVVRISDEKDKRNKRIYLTHKGRSMQQELWPLAEDVVSEAAAAISDEDIATCKKVLETMYYKLNK
jgi:DNA-binding MarR family transcriptional regulator